MLQEKATFRWRSLELLEKTMTRTTEVSADILAPLTADELRKIDAHWHACNYLAAGMIYLRANPLLREPLRPEHIKHRLLGHWGRIRDSL
jgi:xylulose-5-phosphate/fructose-6-phosphate phosphoketolase